MPQPPLQKRECERFTVFGMTVRCRLERILKRKSYFEEYAYPVIDLSRGGLKFLTQTGIPEGTRIVLQLLSPEDQQLTVLKGTTVWMAINPGQSYQYQIGVQFAPYGLQKDCNPPACLDILEGMEKQHLNGHK